MFYSHGFVLCQRHRYLFLIFLLILSTTQVRYKAEGRPNPKSDTFSKKVNEEKKILSGQIGSRPPRCDRRCSSCGHCEAIQVPTNPQVRNGNKNFSTLLFGVAYARRVDNSNYKPMSWKCKCGNVIFNP
ncbi:hypothetical protein ERO13_D12G078200v2 [Gossypium hirsutum]|uniref:Epidermal patterning factor-like protein n=4 Tax=Gossypium TaxID=3633 RepID=A0A1U8NIA4_GOSHI|nr:EPIDERMAL PATTERNING FACTOR-like protein 2 [Gossypium hirsutum]XP_040962546.1 EPIDERMAL PATTERNING FACTOR-like protein 2 [Gossypium hirsutum]TYG40445.1 hypothetical protein ES288_D12G093300v1 [Gossypium darwinii]TYH38198.1 hypothetical protein ES332_D12G094300v1 [Gossypium tomentosum]TYI50249.1 hypothetical protein E1A91_D12G089100v1 [Gossypium mustelinum]KAG4115047.1 hypothetical protein ERO13_D12G078200v2 [Gossypium hirsutum]